jgi:hypothetical protein
VGYELDPAYVELARARLAAESGQAPGGDVGADAEGAGIDSRTAAGDGASATALARGALESAGFGDVRPNRRVRGPGLAVDFTALDRSGRTWLFDVAGPNSAYRGGMARSETVWRALGRAHVLAAHGVAPFVVLTTQLPRPGTEPDRALRSPGPGAVFDVVDLHSPAARQRLGSYAGGRRRTPAPGFWTAADLAQGRT